MTCLNMAAYYSVPVTTTLMTVIQLEILHLVVYADIRTHRYARNFTAIMLSSSSPYGQYSHQ